MNLHCPDCGASYSVDVALADADARKAVSLALSAPAELARPLLSYLRLFEPRSRKMAWAKFLRLLGELMPMLEAQTVTRDGQTSTCTHAAWHEALCAVRERAQAGKLSVPLTTHGYLLEVAVSSAERIAASAEADRERVRNAPRASSGHSPAVEETPAQKAQAAKDFAEMMAQMNGKSDSDENKMKARFKGGL